MRRRWQLPCTRFYRMVGSVLRIKNLLSDVEALAPRATFGGGAAVVFPHPAESCPKKALALTTGERVAQRHNTKPVRLVASSEVYAPGQALRIHGLASMSAPELASWGEG